MAPFSTIPGSSNAGTSTPMVCVDTERVIVKCRNHAVIGQWPELALIGINPKAATKKPLMPTSMLSVTIWSSHLFMPVHPCDGPNSDLILRANLNAAWPSHNNQPQSALNNLFIKSLSVALDFHEAPASTTTDRPVDTRHRHQQA